MKSKHLTNITTYPTNVPTMAREFRKVPSAEPAQLVHYRVGSDGEIGAVPPQKPGRFAWPRFFVQIMLLVVFILVIGQFHSASPEKIEIRRVGVEQAIASSEQTAFNQNDQAQGRYVEMMANSASVRNMLLAIAMACPASDGIPGN